MVKGVIWVGRADLTVGTHSKSSLDMFQTPHTGWLQDTRANIYTAAEMF